MTGFIRGLFGRKPKKAQNTIKAQQSGQAYFLDDDSAKTLGDIDYMRKSKQIRRTFPKVDESFNVAGSERVRQVSAMEDRDYSGNSQPTPSVGNTPGASMNPNSSTSSNSSSTSSNSDFQRRTANTDTNMDMFRNMAKNIKRR